MALRPDFANQHLILVVGAIVIWWGRIEGMIFQEAMNLDLHPDVSAAGICRPLQISTDRLIDQWAKASRLITADDLGLQAEISKLKADLKECANLRHILVHGFWDYPTEDQEPLESKVTILKPERGGGVRFEQHNFDYETLVEFHDRLFILYHWVMQITGVVSQRVPLGAHPRD